MSSDAIVNVANEAAYSFSLCEAIAGWRYDLLPPPVVRTLKAFLLDQIGVIAGAAHAPGIEPLHARLARWEPAGSATALIGKRRLSPPSAALANGASGHALDYDDQHDPARVHTNCVVLPTLLAVAEDVGPIDGKRFIAAYAVGAEIHARLGLACYNSLGKGWHPTMVFGTLAAALAGGHLLGFDARRLADTLGIAFHQTSGSAQSMREAVLTKRLGPGFAARAAVLSVFLAADGIGGTRRTLEGNAGLFSLYERGEVKPELLMNDLASHWRILEYSLKPYPCCRCNHAAIDLAIGLNARGIRPEQVKGIEIRLGHVNWLTVGAPYEPSRDDIVHAQFNVAYSFARALTDGAVGLRSYTRPGITDPEVVRLTALTRVIDDASIESTAIEPARVKLTLRDGVTLQAGTERIKGSPADRMSEAERMAKFRDCLDFGLGTDRAGADRLAGVLQHIERAADVAGSIVSAFPDARG
ncbi:MAG: MmgE/PrpD family protein [Burkholderiales bacterium]|nr:MmgE/PrpD family protein [Burkholderiales bacterium]